MLRYLLNFWFTLIFGMTFAAGAGVLDGAAVSGGGDAGAGDGGSDSGAEGVGAVDSAADDGGSDDPAADDGGAVDDDSAGVGDDTNADESRRLGLDTKGFTPEDKKLLALAQKAGPKEAQRVRQLLFAEKRLQKVVPGGVKAVAELVRSVEEFGGLEGVQELQSQLEAYTADSQDFEANPSKWVENGFTENPDSSLKAFIHSLDLVSEKFPEQYDHLMAKVIMNDLGALPIHEIHALLAGLKDNPQATALAKKLAEYYNSRHDTAKKVPEKKPDVQNKALTDRETAINEKEMNLRRTQISAEVLPALKATVVKTLRDEAKTRKNRPR